MRYYFHVYRGVDGFELDRLGVELPDLHSAWSHAFALIRQMARSPISMGNHAHVYLADSEGTGFLIPFSMAIDRRVIEGGECIGTGASPSAAGATAADSSPPSACRAA